LRIEISIWMKCYLEIGESLIYAHSRAPHWQSVLNPLKGVSYDQVCRLATNSCL
jgi:hypothetical protein